ncbi:MAG: multidrug effflux MFS transporter [Rhodospirillales bacterium]|nr:multidrug effflux MFS transporter [Rhodospirillales bacterium]
MAVDRSGAGFKEFVILMGMLTSLVAMSIDSMLPALPFIAEDLGAKNNQQQFVISTFMLSFGVAQMVFGPLSDALGRRSVILFGILIYIAGSMLCVFAADFPDMLIGRALQGIGVAGPRVTSIAIVRDKYQGDAMARVMSLIMMVFILGPILAPALGQGILLIADWRSIFGCLIGLSLVVLVWFGWRQPETLPQTKRRAFSPGRIAAAVVEIFRTRASIGYIVMSGLIFSSFVGYLNSAQQIFQDIYGLGRLFPLYFAALASALGLASFLNAHLVMKFGMRRICRAALIGVCFLSVGFTIIAYAMAGVPPLALLMAYLLPAFFCFGILFGNFVALSMEPLGHIAGVGASAVGSISSLISVPLGAAIGLSFNGTVLPLVSGFAFFSVAAFCLMQWIEAKKPPTR